MGHVQCKFWVRNKVNILVTNLTIRCKHMKMNLNFTAIVYAGVHYCSIIFHGFCLKL